MEAALWRVWNERRQVLGCVRDDLRIGQAVAAIVNPTLAKSSPRYKAVDFIMTFGEAKTAAPAQPWQQMQMLCKAIAEAAKAERKA